MNISQIKTQGSGIVLENITVVNDYGVKAGATTHRALLVKDSSDQTIVKLWGDSANSQIVVGGVITIKASPKGEIKPSEYQGKISLNCNECSVIPGGGNVGQDASTQTAVQATQPTTPIHNPTVSLTVGLSAEELADSQSAHFSRLFKRLNGMVAEGHFSGDTAASCAALMTGSADGWWFGHKYPGCPK